MIRLLASVRSVDEARVAAGGGADFIDLKEPGQGALGGLPLARVRAIVSALQAQGSRLPLSATIGDWPMQALPAILERVQAVADCGVDLIKVGIEREPAATAVLAALAACGRPVVPVFIADRGLDDALVAQALALGFPALMLDTADKRSGTLFDCLPEPVLRRFIALGRAAGLQVGIAGALKISQLNRIAALAPDFAGFRSALCDGDRGGRLDGDRLRSLVAALRAAQSGSAGSLPSSIERTRASSAR